MAVEYSMRISRQTVDKLGVKLYDKVSAVIAELISNSYDADARSVTVSAPMGQALATKAGGELSDKGLEIVVADNGAGMTPDQVQEFFLVVGSERRKDPRRGSVSSKYKRRVMGRKGVGKLAPFGICRTIEVRSAGGKRITRNTQSGYLTSHIVLDYNKIVTEHDETDSEAAYKPYKPVVGELDNTLSAKKGTSIRLRDFNYRRVPDIEILSRQIAQRFGLSTENWEISLVDNTKTGSDPEAKRIVGAFDIVTMANTKITFEKDKRVTGPDGELLDDLAAGIEHGGLFYPITGWMAYSKEPYKDELMAGVRIYCNGKIAAQTNVFNRRAGFTGEHNIRSYLVGELEADWLDEDEDLIQTDRRDILWSDELGIKFQEWGQRMVLRIGNLSRDPMRRATLDIFLHAGDVQNRIAIAYPSESEKGIRERAIEVAKMFGRTMSPTEAHDAEAVEDLVDLSIGLAPHITLDEMMRSAADDIDTPLATLSSLLRTARIAELSSFGRIAEDRLKVMNRLEQLKDSGETEEDSLQVLIDDAPWLINPEWAPVTANQSLSTLKKEFVKYYKATTGESITLGDFSKTRKRPDFVLSSQDGVAQIIEIKRPHHKLTNTEMDRIVTYYECMESFLEDPQNAEFRKIFRDFHVTLVCDGKSLKGAQRGAYSGYKQEGRLTHINWTTFLMRTERVHTDFLNEAKRQRAAVVSRGAGDEKADGD